MPPLEPVMNPKERERSWRKAGMSLTYPEYELMYEKADGRCEICHKPLSKDNGNSDVPTAHLDHDHKTGEARGILCANCNRAMGKLETWNRKNMIRTAEYILNRCQTAPVLIETTSGNDNGRRREKNDKK